MMRLLGGNGHVTGGEILLGPDLPIWTKSRCATSRATRWR